MKTRNNIKRVGILFLQVLVTAGGIFYVFHDPQRRGEITQALRHADRSWLLIGWLCYSAVEIFATVRWQILLRIQGISLGWLRAAGVVMVGLFFNMFLPGLIGGDLVRLYFVFKRAPEKKTQATLSVAMDRLFGLLSILFLAGLVLSFRFNWLRQSAATLHIAWLALALLGGALVFVVALFSLVGFGALHRLPKRLFFRKAIVESGQALEVYRKHPAAMALAFVTTIISHLAYYVSFYCAGQSLRASDRVAGLVDMISIMPLVNTVTSIPISIGGLGVRETLFQQLLGNLAHVPASLAALTASLGFAIQASWGIVGAAAYFLAQSLSERRRRR